MRQPTLFIAIDEAYTKIAAEIELTAPEADDNVRQIAGNLYEALPDRFIIEWKGRKTPVPRRECGQSEASSHRLRISHAETDLVHRRILPSRHPDTKGTSLE